MPLSLGLAPLLCLSCHCLVLRAALAAPLSPGTYIHYGKPAAILRSYELYLKENSGGNKDALRSVLTVRSAWWLQQCMAGDIAATCAAIALPSALTAPVAQLLISP